MERRDFLKLAGFALGTSVIACSGLNPADFPGVVTATPNSRKSESNSSRTQETITVNNADSTQAAPIEVPNPTPTETFVDPKSPEAFYLQGVNFNRPHKIILPIETSQILGFGADETSHEDIPILSTEKNWTSQETDIMKSAGIDNSNGNPFILVQSDLRGRILFFMAHSYQRSSIGEKVRLAGRLLIKNKADSLLGKPWNVQFGEDPSNQIEGKIVVVENIPVDLFESTWAQYSDKPNDPKFGRTDARGIPDAIRNDGRKGIFYIAYVSCISNDGEPHYQPLSLKYDTYENSRQRAMVVVQYRINS